MSCTSEPGRGGTSSRRYEPGLAATFATLAPPLPDQGPIDPNSLESQRLVEGDGGTIEVVDEERDDPAAPGHVAADLAQQGPGVAAAAVARMRPDAHELDGVGGHRRVLALRGDDAVDDA